MCFPSQIDFSLMCLRLNSGWEVIAEDETKEAENHGLLSGLDISSPGMTGHKQGHGSSGIVTFGDANPGLPILEKPLDGGKGLVFPAALCRYLVINWSSAVGS